MVLAVLHEMVLREVLHEGSAVKPTFSSHQPVSIVLEGVYRRAVLQNMDAPTAHPAPASALPEVPHADMAAERGACEHVGIKLVGGDLIGVALEEMQAGAAAEEGVGGQRERDEVSIRTEGRECIWETAKG